MQAAAGLSWAEMHRDHLLVCDTPPMSQRPTLIEPNQRPPVTPLILMEVRFSNTAQGPPRCFPHSLPISTRDPEKSPAYSEFLYLCGNHWTPSHSCMKAC